MTKEGLAARVVDRQQVYRTISKEEMLHLFDFGDDENADPLLGLGQEKLNAADLNISSNVGGFPKQKVPSPGSTSSDKVMQSLISKHQPRYTFTWLKIKNSLVAQDLCFLYAAPFPYRGKKIVILLHDIYIYWVLN